MKALLVALALHGGADEKSFGIGMDVLPEAFTFAASRVGYTPHLALAGCDNLRCRWHLGSGVEMTASLTPGTLDLDRIEAEAAAPADTPGTPYAAACLTIVALLAPEASPDERRSIARAIAAPPVGARRVRLDMPDTGYSFYGARKPGAAARCGATPVPVGIGSKL